MGTAAAIILGIVSLVGTIVGFTTNKQNNEFIEDTNEQNREFQEETNLQNHLWSLEAAEWEYNKNKPQTQYADLLAAGITPAAAAQHVSGANVSYSPATAVAPQNMPKSTSLLNDSLSQVIEEIGNYTSMAQAEAATNKTMAETTVISETGVKKALAEVDKILADTLKSYSDIDLNKAQTGLTEAQTDLANSNTALTNERVSTESVSRRSIQLTNQEKEIQLEFTRKTLEMSIDKTQAEIKLLSEQTAMLREELDISLSQLDISRSQLELTKQKTEADIDVLSGQSAILERKGVGLDFENKYKEWRDIYIKTYGVAPEQGWEDTFFKAVVDGNAEPMLDAFTEALRMVFDRSTEHSIYGRLKQRFKSKPLRSYSYIDENGNKVYVPGMLPF